MLPIKRIYGSFDMQRHGPTLIVVAGMHGNEWAGVKAVDLMLKMLEVEPIANPGFEFNGSFVGLCGNLPALKQKVRFISEDLNRIWTKERIETAGQKGLEDKELYELYHALVGVIQESPSKDIVVLDMHTTTAEGGIFSLPFASGASAKIAKAIGAPVIAGIERQLVGTMIHYLEQHGSSLFPGQRIHNLVFEAGQHTDPLSVNRAIAAITSCMEYIGCVRDRDIEHAHRDILRQYSKGLPVLSKVLYGHKIKPGDQFEMLPGYQNFDSVIKGQMLARDHRGDILAKADGLILMPLYQEKGNDGFFIIKEIRSESVSTVGNTVSSLSL